MKIGSNTPPYVPPDAVAAESVATATAESVEQPHGGEEHQAEASCLDASGVSGAKVTDQAEQGTRDWASMIEGINTISRILCRPSLGASVFREVCQESGIDPKAFSPEQIHQLDLAFDLELQLHQRAQPAGTTCLDLAAARHILAITLSRFADR